MKRLLGPKGGYYLATILGIIAYRLPNMTVHWEGGQRRGRTWTVLIGNTETCSGGSMRVCPGARCDDGEMNVSIFPSVSKLKMLFGLLKQL